MSEQSESISANRSTLPLCFPPPDLEARQNNKVRIDSICLAVFHVTVIEKHC